MLCDVLGLENKPKLRPASITGYECKLWGQYPALLDAPEKVVHGAVWHVETKEHAKRLAEYETDNYEAEPCRIDYTDGNEPWRTMVMFSNSSATLEIQVTAPLIWRFG
jgi:hypothetical protein